MKFCIFLVIYVFLLFSDLDESYLANGYLDTQIDWIPGMRNIRLRDFPSFIRTTDPDDIMVSYNTEQATNSLKAWGLILNTFDDFEHEVLDAIKSKFPRLYTVGPLFSLCNRIPESPTKAIELNLWKEDDGCIEWLDQREAASVIYVNFGSIAIVTSEQLREFAWGFANSEHPFLWIIRPDLVRDDSGILSEEFFEATRGRCLISSWCAQEQVLAHPSVGGFLTHCGWNSMLESICGGIPMLCWPFFSEQYTNCRYAGEKWGIGMEVDNNVKRDEIEGLVRELMEGQKGKEMRKNAMEWKEKGENAIKQGGSSYVNIDRLFRDVLSTMAN